MDELIFFAVIIFFSIIESIARCRKKMRQGAEAPDESFPLPDPSEWETKLPDLEKRSELPTYDEDPSYDDRYQPRSRAGRSREGRSREGHTPPDRATRPTPERSRSSSEELLPGDLLEELAKMAGKIQEREATPLELPRESPPLPQPAEARAPRPIPDRARTAQPARSRLPVRAPRSVPARPEHRVHLAHAGYGTDPSERPKSFHDTLDPLAQQLSADARAVRAQLRSQDTSALRQAFILREVLGEPRGMRE